MLGKLLKHDFKSLSRHLLLLHAAAVVLTLIGRIFVTIAPSQEGGPAFLLNIYIAVLVLFLIVTMIATTVLIAVHFYRSLFSRQGYLTWTLPATAGQHLFSKTTAACLWSIASLIINIGCIIFLFSTELFSADWSTAATMFRQQLGISLSTFIWYMIITTIVGCISGVMSVYVSIAIGQLFSSHRVLGAFICYAVISFTLQIVISFFMIGAMANGSLMEMSIGADSMSVNTNAVSSYISQQILITIILGLVESIIFYVVTHYIMKKKINLQ